MNKKAVFIASCLFMLCCSVAVNAQKKAVSKTGTLHIRFVNTIHNEPVVLNDSIYVNPFGESYTLRKLKYYISNITLTGKGTNQKEKNSYHLVDETKQESLKCIFQMKAGQYSSLGFLLGVDSARNSSGAQTGALDPTNDMFWTWNSGYVMFKLEGTSPVSNQYNNRLEYHIGGFTGENNVLKKISLPAIIKIAAGKTTNVIVLADVEKFWSGETDIRIKDTPVCTTPGLLSKQIAGNYSRLFSIFATISNP